MTDATPTTPEETPAPKPSTVKQKTSTTVSARTVAARAAAAKRKQLDGLRTRAVELWSDAMINARTERARREQRDRIKTLTYLQETQANLKEGEDLPQADARKMLDLWDEFQDIMFGDQLWESLDILDAAGVTFEEFFQEVTDALPKDS